MNKVNDLLEDSNYINFFLHIHEAHEYTYNIYNHVALLDQCYSAHALFGKFNSVPGLVSNLHHLNPHQLEILQHANPDTLCIAYDTGLNGFSLNSLPVHFGAGYDSNAVQELRMMVHTEFEIPFIYSVQFNADAVKKIHGHKLLLLNHRDVVLRWFIQELNLQSFSTDFQETSDFCLKVAKDLGCDPITSLGEDPYKFIPKHPLKAPLPSKLNDILNWVHAEIQQCPVNFVSKQQIFASLSKWSGSLESSLHLMYAILDYLKPIRDKLLIHGEAVPIDFATQLTTYTNRIEKEPIYNSFIIYATQVFDNLHARDLDKHKIHVEALEDESQRTVYLQYLISLYDFLKHHTGMHYQAVQKVLSEFKTCQVAQQTTIQPQDSLVPPNPSEMSAVSANNIHKPQNQANEDLAKAAAERHTFTEKEYVIEAPALGIFFNEIFDKSNHPFPACVREFFDNGALKSEIYHHNEIKHGPSTFYDSNGRQLSKGWFVHNERTGVNYQYYRHGQIYSIQRYKRNQAEGIQEFYYPDGVLKTKYYCLEGKKEGEALLFYPSGQLKRRMFFKTGRRHGLEESWYPDGIKELEGEYEYGRPIGTIKSWHANGKLAKQMTFHKFPNDFDMTLWNEEGQVIKTTTKSTDAMSNLVERTQELKKLLDETTLNFINLLDKKNL